MQVTPFGDKMKSQPKPQMNLRAIAAGFVALLITLFICGILTFLVLLPSGYPLW